MLHRWYIKAACTCILHFDLGKGQKAVSNNGGTNRESCCWTDGEADVSLSITLNCKSTKTQPGLVRVNTLQHPRSFLSFVVSGNASNTVLSAFTTAENCVMQTAARCAAWHHKWRWKRIPLIPTSSAFSDSVTCGQRLKWNLKKNRQCGVFFF